MSEWFDEDEAEFVAGEDAEIGRFGDRFKSWVKSRPVKTAVQNIAERRPVLNKVVHVAHTVLSTAKDVVTGPVGKALGIALPNIIPPPFGQMASVAVATTVGLQKVVRAVKPPAQAAASAVHTVASALPVRPTAPSTPARPPVPSTSRSDRLGLGNAIAAVQHAVQGAVVTAKDIADGADARAAHDIKASALSAIRQGVANGAPGAREALEAVQKVLAQRIPDEQAVVVAEKQFIVRELKPGEVVRAPEKRFVIDGHALGVKPG